MRYRKFSYEIMQVDLYLLASFLLFEDIFRFS